MRTWLENLGKEDKNKMLVQEAHVTRLSNLIDLKLKEEKVKMIFVKSLMGMLAPKTYQGIEKVEQERALFTSFVAKLDWKKLEGKFSLTRNWRSSSAADIRSRILLQQIVAD